MSFDHTTCSVCNIQTSTFMCRGCLKDFCFDHLSEHRKSLHEKYHLIEDEYNQFKQTLNDQKQDSNKHALIQRINQWEFDSIIKIKQIANECRQELINYTNNSITKLETQLNEIISSLKSNYNENKQNDLNEIHLEKLQQKLNNLKQEFSNSTNISTKQRSTSFINKANVRIPLHKDTAWDWYAETIATGDEEGNQFKELSRPQGICIDNNQTIYIADSLKHRIVEWKSNEKIGRIVVGGNGTGNQTNELCLPRDCLIDKENNSLIIADQGNRRVILWPLQNSTTNGQIIIKDIDCCGLAMDKDGSLYVSDWKKNEVKRWKKGETIGQVVAGGNGHGDQLNQLNTPGFIFVDDNYSLYISDWNNHRVMKWSKDAREGETVAGGNGNGDAYRQLSYPAGVIVNHLGEIYVVDSENHRVMRWFKEEEGELILGDGGQGCESNEFNCPSGLSLDIEGNFYVVDCKNDRIQKFQVT